jgi:hypothetical protein
MSTGIILETNQDKTAETLAIGRIANLLEQTRGTIQTHRLPDLSRVDYLLSLNGVLTWAIEVKTRKQTAQQIQQYGGLMLKHRKILELQQIAESLQLSTWLLFAFENGGGAMYVTEPSSLTHLETQTPPRRHNYRGLACDDEPIVYLDWNRDLRRVA